jgi:hypothetical protein
MRSSSSPAAQRRRARTAQAKALLSLLVPVFIATNWAFNDQFPVVSSTLHFLAGFGLPRLAWIVFFCCVSVTFLIRAYLETVRTALRSVCRAAADSARPHCLRVAAQQMDAYGKVKSQIGDGPSLGAVGGWFGSKQVGKDAQVHTFSQLRLSAPRRVSSHDARPRTGVHESVLGEGR